MEKWKVTNILMHRDPIQLKLVNVKIVVKTEEGAFKTFEGYGMGWENALETAEVMMRNFDTRTGGE